MDKPFGGSIWGEHPKNPPVFIRKEGKKEKEVNFESCDIRNASKVDR